MFEFARILNAASEMSATGANNELTKSLHHRTYKRRKSSTSTKTVRRGLLKLTDMDAQLKELLRRDKIKLWTPPYTVEGRECGSYPADVLNKYGREIGCSPSEVEACLEKIRKQAVERLEANKKFDSTGAATLYVSRIAVGTTSNSSNPSTPTDSRNRAPQDSTKAPVSIECRLDALGQELRDLVAAAFSIEKDDFKMIGHARIIEDNRLLHSQGVEHGMDILCILLTEEERNTTREQTWLASADRTRDAVKRLIKSQESADAEYLHITDQHGNPVKLPDEESVALAQAMALHEKGRKAMKQRHYGQALLYLLEADKEFERCRSDILQLVDNYAILCLDIVWCYLRLQRVNSLPDAEHRLRLADEGFRRSYGPNFERLAKIRKGIMHERALIIRLKLLQGALAYYQRRYRHAHEYLASVCREIKSLEVDDTKLSQLMAMGYSATEARLGLRASSGSIERAVHHIIEERENEQHLEKERQRQRREKSLQKRFGKTPSGKWIDIETYDNIVGMGFRKRATGEALRQADNDMNAALEILRVLPGIQAPGDDLVESIEDTLFDRQDAYSQEEIISQITGLGFPADTLTEALRSRPDDIVGAVEALLASGASGPLQALSEANPGFRDSVVRIAHELQEHHDQYGRRNRHNNRPGNPTAEREQEADHAAYKLLEEDMSDSLHAHLDTTFEEELRILEMLQPLVIPHLQ